MSPRDEPVVRPVTVPDGRTGVLRIGLAEDPYLGRSADTVTLELTLDGEPVAALTTLLGADDVRARRELAEQLAAGLESGDLEPTAGALEPLANEPR